MSKEHPFFSVICVVFNTEKYIGECIDSVTKQSFDDFEFVIIDDGSTDKTNAICTDYAKKDERIRLIKQENKGVYEARIKGIKEAKGKYLYFVDGDDIISNKCLWEAYSKLQNNEDILFVNAVKINENNKSYPLFSKRQFKKFEKNPIYHSLITCDLGFPWTRFVKRNLYLGMVFPKLELSIKEDWLLLTLIIKKASSIAFDNTLNYFYIKKHSTLTKVNLDKLLKNYYTADMYVFENIMNQKEKEYFEIHLFRSITSLIYRSFEFDLDSTEYDMYKKAVQKYRLSGLKTTIKWLFFKLRRMKKG